MSKKMIYTAPTGKKIIFDAYEKNTCGGFWTDICPSCIKKYKDILQDKLDEAGSGFSCCYVCGCSNNNAGTYVDFTKDEVTFVEEEPEIVGFVTQFGEDDYSYWNGFSLTDKEKKQIQEIICRHDTEGYSISGSKKEILKDMSSQEDPVKDAEIEKNIRKCLNQIYAETDILPENFGENILQELKSRFAEDSYEITKKTVLEEMLWCYVSRMQ